MMQAPEQDLSLLPPDEALKIRYAFQAGNADNCPPVNLVKSGAVQFCPLHGGIYERRQAVKYIIMHSTETGVPQDARHVINSWSSGGLRHPGAQYIVDRDGTIFETVDPKYATVHVNVFKTLPGINNDNTIGIEMCHAGSQIYPQEQRASVIRLVSYLQDRYHVVNDNVITHRYAQQGDHTDPVAFDFPEFLARKDDFHNKALASRIEPSNSSESAAVEPDSPPAAVYLEVHQGLKDADRAASVAPAPGLTLPASQLQKALHPAPANPTASSLTVLPPAAPNVTGQQPVKPVVAPPTVKQFAPAPMQAPNISRGNLPIRGEIEVAPGAASEVQQVP
jgi:N-acetylmuramoyl-L-alanine amidase